MSNTYESLYGHVYDVRWFGGYVQLRINEGAWSNAFALSDELPLDIRERGNGDLVITYKGNDESLVSKTSRDHGETWA